MGNDPDKVYQFLFCFLLRPFCRLLTQLNMLPLCAQFYETLHMNNVNILNVESKDWFMKEI